MGDCEIFSFRLPYPPSVNHYWKQRRNGQRYVTKEGVKYKQVVKELLRGNRCLDCELTLCLEVFTPDRRRRDLDNILKCLLDSIVASGLIKDDDCSIVKRLVVEHKGVCKNKEGVVILTIKSYEPRGMR